MGAPKDSPQMTAMVRIFKMRRGLVQIFVRTENSDLADMNNCSLIDPATYKASGITNAYGTIVKVGRMVFVNFSWAGSITGSNAIVTLPEEYRPARSFFGGHVIIINGSSGEYVFNGNCGVNSVGKIYDNTTANEKVRGTVSLAYYI